MSQQTSALAMQPATQRAIVGFDELWGMAEAVAKSKLFACKTTEEAVTLMMLAQAEGVHPIQAMRMYHIINGRPSMRADAMQAKFQQRGGRVRWVERSDEVVTAEFSHPDLQPNPLSITWDDERVKLAGIKKDNHLKFPAQMKAARCISEGVGAIMPEVKMGLYTPEEIEGFADQPQPPIPRVIEAKVVEPARTPDSPDAAFLTAWDVASRDHGITPDDGRLALRVMLKRRQVEFAAADASARESTLAEYGAWTAEQVKAFNDQQAKRRAEKDAPKAAAAAAAAAEPAPTATVADADASPDWDDAMWVVGAAAGVDAGVLGNAIAAHVDAPPERQAEILAAAKAGRFDWASSAVLDAAPAPGKVAKRQQPASAA